MRAQLTSIELSNNVVCDVEIDESSGEVRIKLDDRDTGRLAHINVRYDGGVYVVPFPQTARLIYTNLFSGESQ